MLKKQKKNSTRRLKTERLLYERMQVMQKLFQQFEEKSRGYQEKNQEAQKLKFRSDLESLPKFNQKNSLVDGKIEFDQRFFTSGYAQFQLMISDVRKQIQINEGILQLREAIEAVKRLDEGTLEQDAHDHHHGRWRSSAPASRQHPHGDLAELKEKQAELLH